MMKLVSVKQNKDLNIIILTILMVLYLNSANTLYLKVGIALGLLGIFFYKAYNPITFAWLKLAEILGSFIPKILFSIIFYIVVFPISMLMKKGHNFQKFSDSKKLNSMFENRNHQYTKADLESPF